MKVALVGNQNCGKTTLFNLLTGSNQKIGNWPGVTIERKEGELIHSNITVVDLPGIYSLSPYTSEEIVSRDFLLNEGADLIINIVDATSLERSLYLTSQLLELDAPVVIALNMADLLEKKGIVIDAEILSKELGVPVVTISALKNTGVDKLVEILTDKKTQKKKNNIKIFPKNIENELKNAENIVKSENKRFVFVKALEGDELFNESKNKEVTRSREIIEKLYGYDIEQVIANERYNKIVEIRDKCLKKISKKQTVTDKLDKVFLNKWLAIPIFVLIMTGVYLLSVGVVGNYTIELMESFITLVSEWVTTGLENLGASAWSISLLVDGVIAGVGAVLAFVPQLIIMFLCISLLETTGYMSRISFIFDKLFRSFGLSGKSLVPFIVGSGCSVPAIMTCRTIEDEKEKQMTVMLTPFIPCSAKLPIIALFAGFFFPNNSGIVSASLYFFAIVVIVLLALFLKRFVFKSQNNSFISELPEYKAPSVKYVSKDVFDKTRDFISRAGTIILFCSVIIWFLSSFSLKFEYGIPIENSILAGIGKLFSWFFYPMLGELNWAASVSAIQGLIAKEQVVSSMTVISGVAGGEAGIFSSAVFAGFNPASAYAFMVFNLFSAPCFGAIGAMRSELGSAKKTWLAVLLQTAVAWVMACLVFGVGSLFLMG